jgi:pimeloyl-ACP methyl ester carboxylesterase
MPLAKLKPGRCLVALAAAAAFALPAGPASAQTPTACVPGAQCGTVTVPLDRADPAAGTLDVAYALLPHTDTSVPAAGTIVPNPGGPGDATIAFPLYEPAFAALHDRFDVLLIDARGTGASGALSCPSIAQRDPLSVDKAAIGRVCAGDLGAQARFYTSAAIADDFDAVRAVLGIDRLDLWGDSYGTFLMPVYAARHPEHVRSIVLDGAFPSRSDPWGRDVLQGMRRVIRVACRRTHRCSGRQLLARVARLGRHLRRHPRKFTANSPGGKVTLTLGEDQLAAVTFSGGDPTAYRRLPAAVQAALRGRYKRLEKLVYASRAGDVEQLTIDPRLFSVAAGAAISCHDYPRPYDLAAPPAIRHKQYRRGLAGLKRRQFFPFSPRAWLSTGIDAGPGCLDWPADPTAGDPLKGRALPDVPVLVMSGDLDDNTPIEQGRRAAAQFPHATLAVVANAGHTPAQTPCGLTLGLDFVRDLQVNADRCAATTSRTTGRRTARR